MSFICLSCMSAADAPLCDACRQRVAARPVPVPTPPQPPRLPCLSSDPEVCTHGVTFDEVAARGLDEYEVRRRWPRFFGTCKHCGYTGIYYASYAHYVMGDW